MIFDRTSIMESARRNIASGPPSTMSESFRSALELNAGTAMMISDESAISDAYDAHIREIRQTAGKVLPNPMNFGVRERAKMEQKFTEDVVKLREEFPDVPHVSPAIIRAAIAEDRQELRERRAEVEQRESGFSTVAAFAGGALPLLADPPVLASMAFGAPLATGILRGALIDAGINVGVEVAVQAAVQSQRRQFGEQPSGREALAAIAAAGVGGFILSGVVRAGVKAARPLVGSVRDLLRKSRKLEARTAEVRDAEAFLQRQQDQMDENPLVDTAQGRAEHVERSSEAMAAVREGRAPHMPERPRQAVRGEPRVVAKLRDADPVSAGIGRALRAEAVAAARLSERERQAIQAAAQVAQDEGAFQAFVKAVKSPPKPEGPRLATFLKRQGGLKEESGELAAMGITARSRPGLINNKRGMDFDTAGLAAFEMGFFRERPTVAEFIDALRDDVSGRPVFASGADVLALEEARNLSEFADALADAGVDIRTTSPTQARQDVLRIAEHIQRGTPAQGHAQAEARIETFPDDTDALDDALEVEVRQLFEGRENELVMVDDGRLISVRDMFDGFRLDADDLDGLRICAGGAR